VPAPGRWWVDRAEASPAGGRRGRYRWWPWREKPIKRRPGCGVANGGGRGQVWHPWFCFGQGRLLDCSPLAGIPPRAV